MRLAQIILAIIQSKSFGKETIKSGGRPHKPKTVFNASSETATTKNAFILIGFSG